MIDWQVTRYFHYEVGNKKGRAIAGPAYGFSGEGFLSPACATSPGGPGPLGRILAGKLRLGWEPD
jgi:hypothetical protein